MLLHEEAIKVSVVLKCETLHKRYVEDTVLQILWNTFRMKHWSQNSTLHSPVGGSNIKGSSMYVGYQFHCT